MDVRIRAVVGEEERGVVSYVFIRWNGMGRWVIHTRYHPCLADESTKRTLVLGLILTIVTCGILNLERRKDVSWKLGGMGVLVL